MYPFVKVGLLLLLALFSLEVGAAGLCHKMYVAVQAKRIEQINEKYLANPRSLTAEEKAFVNEDTIKVLQEIEAKILKYNRDVDKYMKKSGRWEESQSMADRHHRMLIIMLVHVENVQAAKRHLDVPFQEFELLAWKLKNKEATEAERILFALRYHEYVAQLSLLERLAGERDYSGANRYSREQDANITEDMKTTAREILDSIGVSELHKDFPASNYPSHRLSRDELQRLFESDPNLRLHAAKRQRDSEIKIFRTLRWQGIIHLDVMKKAMYAVLPPGMVEPVSRVLGMSYNNYVINKYMPMIDQVINMRTQPLKFESGLESMSFSTVDYIDAPVTNPARRRYDLLRTVSSGPNQMEMLVTFARLGTPGGAKVYMEIRAEAENLARQGGSYANFFEKMKAAEAVAKRHPDLSIYIPNPPVARTSVLIGSGSAGLIVWFAPSIARGIDWLRINTQFF